MVATTVTTLVNHTIKLLYIEYQYINLLLWSLDIQQLATNHLKVVVVNLHATCCNTKTLNSGSINLK